MKQTATASQPLARICPAMSSRASASSSASTVPSAAIRSPISRRRSLGTSGLGRWNLMSNSPPISRRVRPISMVSRNPSVVTSAVFAPLRSSSVLVAMVVPCTKTPIAAASMPSAPSAFSTPRHCRPGSEGTLAESSCWVFASRQRMSVNVPPTSTPMRYPVGGSVISVFLTTLSESACRRLLDLADQSTRPGGERGTIIRRSVEPRSIRWCLSAAPAWKATSATRP